MTSSIEQNAPVGEVVTVLGKTTDLKGRFTISAGHNHFVSDAKAASGGPGEAIQAGELLLSALASCSLSIIQKHAAEIGIQVTEAVATVSFERDPDDITRYRRIWLHFRLAGVDQATAVLLVKQFTDTCPIYNTLRRGGNIGVEVEGRPKAAWGWPDQLQSQHVAEREVGASYLKKSGGSPL